MDVMSLGGQTRRLAGVDVLFETTETGRTMAWRGGEGYACRVRINGGQYVLKWHFLPCNERRARTAFLAKLGLHQVPEFLSFRGAPAYPVRGPLEDSCMGTVEPGDGLDGYVSHFVHGKELDALRAGEWAPSSERRVTLSTQLCVAIEALETCDLAHGDLSPANVIVSDFDGSANEPQLTLIDFDGFYHPAVPAIPLARERGGRPKGTPGYRAPAFRGADAVPNSDRLALAILVVELMALQPADWKDLKRDEPTLLNQQMLNERRLLLPDELRVRWPEGFDLLEGAVSQEHPSTAPSPREWRHAVQRFVLAETREQHTTIKRYAPRSLTLSLPNGMTQRVELRQAHGSLERVHPSLNWASYRDSKHGLVVTGHTSGKVFVRAAGGVGAPDRLSGAVDLHLAPGDQLVFIKEGERVEVEVGPHPGSTRST